MSRKYTLSIPDSSMFGCKVSGVNEKNNPFKVAGEVLLKVDRDGMIQYEVVRSDFKKCFPIGEKFWNTTTMFCNGINWNLNESKSPQDPWYNQEAQDLLHCNFFVYSKHKVDTNHWKIIVYRDEVFVSLIDEMVEGRHDKLIFSA